ncbi:MAG: hypothetical protein ACYTEQ_19835 [Planctomycetota bacterium]|jgi:hypothetical protein
MAYHNRLTGRIWATAKFAQINNAGNAIAVVKYKGSQIDVRKIEQISNDRLGDYIDLDLVLDDSENVQDFLNAINAFITTERCEIHVHQCFHNEFEGIGDGDVQACPAPFASLVLNVP